MPFFRQQPVKPRDEIEFARPARCVGGGVQHKFDYTFGPFAQPGGCERGPSLTADSYVRTDSDGDQMPIIPVIPAWQGARAGCPTRNHGGAVRRKWTEGVGLAGSKCSTVRRTHAAAKRRHREGDCRDHFAGGGGANGSNRRDLFGHQAVRLARGRPVAGGLVSDHTPRLTPGIFPRSPRR